MKENLNEENNRELCKSFTDPVVEDLISEVDAFLNGELVRCFYCQKWVPAQSVLCDSWEVDVCKTTTEKHHCEQFLLSIRCCNICDSINEVGQEAQLRELNSQDDWQNAWICVECHECQECPDCDYGNWL